MILTDPSTINFGDQYAGSPSLHLVCKVNIVGSESNINIVSPTEFQISVDSVNWRSSISMESLSDESFDLYIRVNSNSKVNINDSIVITCDSISLNITVKANIVSLKVQPFSINFYNVYAGVRSTSVEMVVSNVNALYDINVEKIVVPYGYKIKDDLGGSYTNEISAFMLGKGESVIFHLVAEPTAVGSFSDSFNITADFVDKYYIFADEDGIIFVDEDDKMFEDSEVSV